MFEFPTSADTVSDFELPFWLSFIILYTRKENIHENIIHTYSYLKDHINNHDN